MPEAILKYLKVDKNCSKLVIVCFTATKSKMARDARDSTLDSNSANSPHEKEAILGRNNENKTGN